MRGRRAVPSVRSKGKAVMLSTSSPFEQWILEEHVPTVKIPSHITYDGNLDPKDHIASYEGHMHLYPRSEATWCKYFLTTLKGVAQTLISKGVKEGSITGWDDLSTKFKSNFSTANRREKTNAELMGLQQGEDKSLRDYLTRFSNESSIISWLDKGLVVFAHQHGLRTGPFSDFMVMNSPQTLEEALSASDKFIRVEEWNKTKIQPQTGGGKQKQQSTEGQGQKSKGKAKASEQASANESKKEKSAPYLGRYESYTPFALPRAKIYSVTKGEQSYRKPRPLPQCNQQKNKNLWCEFHESPGHNIEECIQLKEQIEDMVQKGYLKKYIADH
ncbi:uncharacterized protein LOC110685576 [Chenopodium quinoa]|uniref:uncharacterized protein LOC110685576 n=1 Tax=Chenopodium quinoa TaxID=63459 RepID=UPI000B79454F|nr:uncharacterized protein LOC110685576 [Chenopodium quinoa]